MFRAVKKGGRLAVIVPEGVLFRKQEEMVRRFLLENAKLQTIVSLPQGVFLPYTGVKTNILYFTDIFTKATSGTIWYFEVKNDGFSLDSHRRKIKANDLKRVEYVNLLKSNNQANDIADIGFKPIEVSKIKANNYILVGEQYTC